MNVAGLRTALILCAALGLVACSGCRSVRIIEQPEVANLSVKWDSDCVVRVTNRGKTPVQGVRIWAKYWQDYYPPHTCGTVEYGQPEGWFTNEVTITNPIQPGESCIVNIRRERFNPYRIELDIDGKPTKPVPIMR